MKKCLALLLIGVFALSACGRFTPVSSATHTPISGEAETPAVTSTSSATSTPAATQTLSAPSPTPTLTLDMLDRPVFLLWPLPAYIGTARISQYPDTPWTWNYLGLNAGYSCPPMFGYLLNLDSLAYWRAISIPEEQDKAQADPHNFEMVECYSMHAGTDIKAPAGTPVYAVADGRIQEWQLSGLNSMLVLKHCLGGVWGDNSQCIGGRQWYTTYMHFIPDENLLLENAEILRGAQLGTIYDQTINSHLHLEVGLEKRSSANFINPWGQDHSPWLGCMWLDQSMCINPDPNYKRIVFYTTGESFFIKQGDNVFEAYPAPGIAQIHLWGNHVLAMNSENNLLMWGGVGEDQSSPPDPMNWQTAVENILEFQVANQRLAILDENRNLWVKENGFDDEWMLQAENIRSFSISDQRLGYISNNGDLLVKEGGLENDCVAVANNVLAFQFIDKRIGYVDGQSNLYANEGEILSEYQQMASSVKAFQLTNVRLGVIDKDDNLLVKEGNLRAGWVLQAENVHAFQLADYRILMSSSDGVFKFKEGSLYQEWSDLPFAGLKEVFLNGQVPVYIH